jgi:hypothetical protein
MRYINKLITVLALSVCGSASAAVINFESYSVNDILTAGTDLGGIFFDHDIQVLDYGQFPPDASGNVAASYDPFAGDFSGEFTSEVTSFSLAVGDNGFDLDDATLSVFDAGFNLLATDSFLYQAAGSILSVSGAGIKYFSVDQTGLVIFDNLTFDTVSAVPEPSIIALFGLGLVGLGFAGRRQI